MTHDQVYALAIQLPPSPVRDRIIDLCVAAEQRRQLRARAVVEALSGSAVPEPLTVPELQERLDAAGWSGWQGYEGCDWRAGRAA